MIVATKAIVRKSPRVIRPHVPWYKDVHAEADLLVPSFARDYIGAVHSARARIPSDVWLSMMATRTLTVHIDDLCVALRDALAPIIERDLTAVLSAVGKLTVQQVSANRKFNDTQFTSRAFDTPPLVGGFDLADPAAIEFIRTQGADLVTGITDEVRLAIRALLAESFEGNWDVQTTAKLLPELVGLTPKQAASVSRYYSGLVANSGNTATRAVDLAKDFAGRQLQARATAIAHTETIRGANAGVIQGFAQAQSQGLLPDTIKKEWIATDDDATCPICEDLDGEKVDIGDDFSSGDNAPPAHTSCRCSTGLAE